MRVLTVLIGVVVVIVGVIGVAAPTVLLRVADYATTPIGLYAAAALRIGIGIVLILVAPASRAPKLIRVFAAIAIAAGLVTALVGIDRARAILAWETAQGPTLIRLSAMLPLVFGAYLVFAVTSRRRPDAPHGRVNSFHRST
jgi:hypothetical protein